MPSRTPTCWFLALIGWFGLAGPATAQVPAREPIPATERTASPVEILTGEREVGEGEEPDEIETDRDSFTPAITTAGRRRLIVESAYTFIDNRRVKETHSYPELILRYGLTDRIELRLGWNYEVGGAGNDVAGLDAVGNETFRTGELERESRISYGAKVRVTKQSRWVPGSAVILQAATPTGGEASTTILTATAVAGWELPNRWKIDGAFRYQSAGETEDRFNAWAPSVVLKVPVGEKWSVHAEYFGIVSSGKRDDFTRHYFSPGVHYLVTPDFEVGVRVGWGLNDQTPRFFSNAGIGWRF